VPLDVRRRAARAVAVLLGDRLSPTRLRKAEPQFGQTRGIEAVEVSDYLRRLAGREGPSEVLAVHI
jgi:hypothetical protein